jgi:hypothetical protein
LLSLALLDTQRLVALAALAVLAVIASTVDILAALVGLEIVAAAPT